MIHSSSSQRQELTSPKNNPKSQLIVSGENNSQIKARQGRKFVLSSQFLARESSPEHSSISFGRRHLPIVGIRLLLHRHRIAGNHHPVLHLLRRNAASHPHFRHRHHHFASWPSTCPKAACTSSAHSWTAWGPCCPRKICRSRRT